MNQSFFKSVLPCVALLAACLPTPMREVDERRIVAMIDSMPVYLEDFTKEFERVKVVSPEGAPSLAVLQAQKQVLLNNLIDRRLVLREAERKNVLVGTDDVEAAYQNSRHGWSESDHKRLLESQDITPSELKRELREQLLVRRYFRDHVFSRVAVTDAEVDAYIDTHPEVRMLAEQVRARQIVVKTEDEATDILKEMRRGLSFQEAAMKYSLTPEGKNGGDLGFFPRGSMPAVLEETCFSMRLGQTSKVVPTEYGFHIIEVLDHRPESVRPMEEVRNDVENVLRRQKEQDAQKSKIAELRKSARIEIQEARLGRVQ